MTRTIKQMQQHQKEMGYDSRSVGELKAEYLSKAGESPLDEFDSVLVRIKKEDPRILERGFLRSGSLTASKDLIIGNLIPFIEKRMTQVELEDLKKKAKELNILPGALVIGIGIKVINDFPIPSKCKYCE